MNNTITLLEHIEVQRPAVDVWRLVADYGRDPEWRAGVKTMRPEPSGIARVGTTTAEELRFAGRTWHNGGEVVVVDPGRRFEWRTTLGARADGARTVVPIGATRCRVTLELNVTPEGLQRLIAALTRRMLRTTLHADAQRLRALAEASAPRHAARR